MLSNAREVLGQTSDKFRRFPSGVRKIPKSELCKNYFLNTILKNLFNFVQLSLLFLVEFLSESDEGMSGCLDDAHCPTCEIDLGEKRNTIASVVAGGLVSDFDNFIFYKFK